MFVGKKMKIHPDSTTAKDAACRNPHFFISLVRIIVQNPAIGLYNSLNKENYGRRHANHMQRLRTGIYLQRCRSGILSRTRLFDPEALQALPHC
jgi:hypothetical protein